MKKKYSVLIFSFFLFSSSTFSQTILFNGIVKDATTHETVIDAAIKADGKNVATTDMDGKFQFNIVAGTHTIAITYLGYEDFIIDEEANDKIHLYELKKSTSELNTVVVSGSKFEKKVSEETVSIQVLKPSFMQNSNITQMDDAINKVPGVDVIDGQANIRGGGGWSYGVGSRVLIMVDDMPMLTADANDAKWDYLPIENCEQVEILKGAASSLYGSSALNGVINFRTAFAKNQPETKITYFSGWGGNSPLDSAQWWGNFPPVFSGVNFFHSQKIQQLDLVIGGATYTDFNRSYLQGDYTTRGRVNMNLRYRIKSVSGLAVGCNFNLQKSKGSTFFYWKNDTSGVYQPYGGLDSATTTVSATNLTRFNIDPYLTYTGSHGFKMSTRTRFFRSNNVNNTHQGSLADLFYTEQQFQKQFPFHLNITAGGVHTYSRIVSELFSNHEANNLAAYFQAEQKIQKLWLSAGWRYELFRVDNQTGNSKPVWRFGANYQVLKATFLRASYGMGYRFPSIAEKFVRTKVGAANVLPNPTLRPETGTTKEIGVKQGIKIGNWMGYVDAAYFSSVYKDMIEFEFNLYYPNYDPNNPPADLLDHLGFESVNVSNAKINGTDLSLMGKGKIGGVDVTVFSGYTYLNPRDLKFDSLRRTVYSDTINFLKYRVRHSLKTDVEANYKKWTAGVSYRYSSNMINVDAIFENQNFFPVNIDKFRKEHNKGTMILDARVFYQVTPVIRLGFIVKNIFNQLYTDRPANPQPPRNYTIQAVFDF